MALALGFGLTAAGFSARAAAIADIGEAINKAGRMRMLSQRMAKAYCQIGLDILTPRSEKILDASRQLFESHLAELTAFSPTTDIRESYGEIEKLWKDYKALLAGKPNLENARRIALINEDVLRMAHLATTQLELHSASSVGRLINIAGRQRMLSQRMAKFYQFRQWGITSASMEMEAQVARREFVSALAALEKAPENNAAVKKELELARVQWLFFEEALNQRDTAGKDKLTYATNVATTSERLLEVMDRTTGLYAQIFTTTTPAPARKR